MRHLIFLGFVLSMSGGFAQAPPDLPNKSSMVEGKNWVVRVLNVEEEREALSLENALRTRMLSASPPLLPYIEKSLGILIFQWYNQRRAEGIDYLKMALTHCRVREDVRRDLQSNLSRVIGIFYSDQNRASCLDSAKYYLVKALQIEESEESFGPEYTKILDNLYSFYEKVGDPDNAAKMLQLWHDHVDRLQDNEELAIVLNEQSQVHSLQLGEPEKGAKLARQGLALKEADALTRLRLTFNLALAQRLMTDLPGMTDTDRYLQESMAGYQKVMSMCQGSDYEKEFLAMAQNNMAFIFNQRGEHRRALDALRKSEAYHRRVGYASWLARNLDNKGDALRGLDRPYQALQCYTEALQNSFTGFPVDHPFALPDPDTTLARDKAGALTTLASRADLLTELFQQTDSLPYLEAALDHYAFIDHFLDDLRSGFLAENSKLNWAQRAKPVLERALATHLLAADALPGQAEHHKRQALHYADQAKGLVLLEFMNRQEAARIALPDSAQHRLFELMQQRDWAESELAWETLGGASASLVRTLRQEVVATRQRLDRFRDQLLESFPDFRRLLQAEDREVLDIERFQSDLPNDQAVLAFFLGEARSYAFVVSRQDLQVEPLPAAADLQPGIRQCLSGIRGYREEGMDYQAAKRLFTRAARRLYRQLIEPLGPLPDRLIIIPDDELLYLPFDVLLTRNADESTAFGDYPYWIRDKTISYAFSIALLEEMRAGGAGRRADLLLLGGFSPLFPQDQFADTGIAPLPASSSFLEKLSRSVRRSRLFDGQAATRDTFLATAGQFRILHPATHTVINEVDPNLTEIRFWDGGIRLKDLFRLRLQADLVVLHSCETSTGRLFRGEGIASLNRGFVSAGAGSVLASFWPLRDGTTPDFMGPLYEDYLLKGLAKDAAVREAKLRMLHEDPFDWAPYALYGDTQPIQRSWFWLPNARYYLLAILVVGLGAALARRARRKKKPARPEARRA